VKKNIYQSFTHKMTAKASCHLYYVTVTLCIRDAIEDAIADGAQLKVPTSAGRKVDGQSARLTQFLIRLNTQSPHCHYHIQTSRRKRIGNYS